MISLPFFSVSVPFYWYASIASLLMFTVIAIIWFKKFWDVFAPVQDADSTMITPPQSKFLQNLYTFSYDIMSNAIWRTVMYLIVVIILVTVSILHLVSHKKVFGDNQMLVNLNYSQIERCSDFSHERDSRGHGNTTFDIDEIIDLSKYEYSSCLNSWVRLIDKCGTLI
jgi:hypothetical protein